MRLRQPDDLVGLDAMSIILWGVVAAMLAVLCVGYWAAHLSIDASGGWLILGVVPLCIAISQFYRHVRPDPWISRGAEAVAQILAILIFATLITYAAAATAFPYRDAQLDALDRALGLNWLGYFDFVASRPWLGVSSNLVYFSMKPQTVLIIAALVATGRFARVQSFTLALAASLALTIAVFVFAPAAGAFAYLGLDDADLHSFTPSMTYQQFIQLEGVRKGALTTIRFDDLEGLIAFPSFHTAAAILAVWALWPIRSLRWWIAALNGAMIASTPCDGAHYFVDLAGGGAVATVGIWAAISVQKAVAKPGAPRRRSADTRPDAIRPLSAG